MFLKSQDGLMKGREPGGEVKPLGCNKWSSPIFDPVPTLCCAAACRSPLPGYPRIIWNLAFPKPTCWFTSDLFLSSPLLFLLPKQGPSSIPVSPQIPHLIQLHFQNTNCLPLITSHFKPSASVIWIIEVTPNWALLTSHHQFSRAILLL